MVLNNNPRREAKHLSLGLVDTPIEIPASIYSEAVEKNRRSLVGRIIPPRKQDLYSVIQELPWTWSVNKTKCHGRLIGNRKFQFLFKEERDLEMVLWSGPYTYNGWLVVLQRWEDEQGPEFLQSVPMWVKIRGIPIRYLCEGTIREIVKPLGLVMEVQFNDDEFDVRVVRVRVDIKVDTRLCFKKVVRFESGEVKMVSFRYEDIARSTTRFKFCRNCGALNHLARSCTHVWVDVPDFNEPPPSPPLANDSSFDGSAEGETSSNALEGVEPAGDAVQELLPGGDGEEQQQGVGTSSEGSKRKFGEVEEESDDVREKRIRGSDDATDDGLMGNQLNPVPEE